MIDAHGTIYEQWSSDALVGLKVTKVDGAVSYVYLNPSSESDDGVSNVFLYQGAAGDPGIDCPVVHVDI